MSVSDDPAALFEPETESIPHSLDEESQSQPDQKEASTVPDNSDNAESKPELQDDNMVQEDNDNTSTKPELQDDSASLTFDTSREDNDNESEKLDTIPPPTTVVNSSDFQKVMDSINEPLHDDKLLDFVSNLDDHPSSQSLDEKLLDSVVEHETPEETMQVEQLMESIHNEKSDIDDRNQLQRNRTNETLTFQKIERSGQITDHKILDENDFKSDKELRLDNGNVTLSTGTSLMLTPIFGDAQTGDGSNIKPVSTIGDESSTNVVTKSEVDDITPESYLSQVTGMVTDDIQQSVPVYDTVENKNDPKVFEAKDCLQKAMEAINQPINEGNDDVGSSVEDVLSALHSDVSSSKDIKDEDTGSSETKSETKITTKESVVPSAKRSTKDLKDKDSPQCFVACCDSGKSDTGEAKRFFKPPPNPLIFKRWARNLCQGSQLLSFNSWICENHFRTSDIQEVFVNGKKKWELSKGALPKINVNKTTFQNFVAKKRSDDKRGRGASLYRATATEEPAESDKKTTAELLSTLTDTADLDTENVDPSVLSFHPNLVKNAQEEITSLDVLVCGLCHTVFHFFEEFQDHKLNINCRGTSTFKASLSEPKPQVWAFLLWKNAQTKIIGDMESSWKLYQRWCKMPENLRDTWVAAGRALQDASSVGHIKITDVSNKIGRPKSVTEQVDMDEDDIKLNEALPIRRPTMVVRKIVRRIRLGDVKEVKMIRSIIPADVPVEIELDTIAGGDSNRISKKIKPFKESIVKTEGSGEIIIGEKIEIKEEPGQLLKPPHDGQIIQEEFVVEKIVSRRLNQKKRQYEYLLKWEGYPPEQNTWEPEENMSTCKHLLKEFEANLAKANKSATVSKVPTSVLTQKKPEIMIPSTSSAQITIPLTAGGRPVRSSKQKALDQVKVWCGSMIKTPDTDIPGKRRSSDIDTEDEEDMAIAKRIKLEQESDDSDSEVSRRPAKRFAGARGGKTPGKPGRPPAGLNGIKKESNLAAALGLESSGEESGPERSPSRVNKPVIRNMSSLSPQNQQVLVASAKGVVKVDPTQVPNLTSGVYIMSNKSGIVKLDSVTPSSALSSLQKKGVLKAAPGKGGVIMLDSSKPGSIAQKSGIIRKVQTATLATTAQSSSSSSESLITSTTSMPTSITVQATQNKTLPKGAFLTGSTNKSSVLSTANLPPRPAGILRPIRPGISPRPTGLLRAAPGGPRLPTSTTKVTPVRSRILSSVTANRPRAPLSNLLKSGIKPIESILGTASSSSNVVQKTESDVLKDEDFPTSSGIVTINPVKKTVTNSIRNRPGRGPVRNVGARRGNLASLVGMTMEDDDKLKEDDDIFTDITDQPSSDTDDGIPDDFPIGDLPPIEPDSPPRPLTLCPLTGKVLLKAEGEKTPEPTPPPSPSAENKEKTVVPEEENANNEMKGEVSAESQSATNSTRSDVATTSSSAVNTVNNNTITITDTSSSSITVKRISSSANQRGSRTVAGNVSVLSGSNSSTTTNTGNTSLGTITVPARKLFHQSQTPVTAPTATTTPTTVTTTEQTEEQDVVTITGEDGLLYQVANADVSGNTLLVSSGEGGQQCVYVTTEASGEHVEGDESSTSAVLTLDTAYADAVAQLIPEQFYVKEGDGGELVSLEEAGEEGAVVSASEDGAGQVVAQLVEAGEPAPGGGPRRVVLLLPDGNLMMTEVDEEQYAALELDK